MEEKIMTLIDARYYGNAMRLARKFLRITTPEAASLLRMPKEQYKRCEIGKEVFPEEVMRRLMNAAFSLLAYKSRK